jgi:Tfp pilus assembly protein PilE
MENATKALLIAAGILIAIMVVTLLILGWNSISEYYQENSESTKQTQLSEFNQQFERYANESSIRGSDMLSLISKIDDYNTRQASDGGDGYQKMKITISIKSTDLSYMKYANSKWNIYSTITEDYLNIILNKISELESRYGSTGEVSKLSANITKFDIKKTDLTDAELEEKIKIANNLLTGYEVTKNNYTAVREDALAAYQITQFKRAYFKCTGTDYDQNTGRIISMTFESTGKFE